MLNAIQAWMLQDSVQEEEIHKGRERAKVAIANLLNGGGGIGDGGFAADDEAFGVHTGVVYDEFGAPRPAPMAYDESYSDDPAPRRQAPPQRLQAETVPTDDPDNPFPGLGPPLG